MARVAYPMEKLREVEKNYHLTTWEQVKHDYPHIEWEALRKAIRFPEFTDVSVEQPEALAEANRMMAETPEKALEKLSAMKLKTGCPREEEWDDYADLKVDERLSYFENMWNITAHENDKFVRRTVNKPVDRDKWHMNAYTVNACYNLVNNDITSPAGILQPPFLCADEDDAYNYGATGAIIGHEMTHGFDDQGRRLEPSGNLNSWWTKEDEGRFKMRSKCLERYFDGMEVMPGARIYGKLTLRENLGDNGGLNIAWDAFCLSMAKTPLPDKGGFTPQQCFFMAFALNYAGSMRAETLKNSVKADVHVPSKQRVNGALPHIDGWYEAFNIK